MYNFNMLGWTVEGPSEIVRSLDDRPFFDQPECMYLSCLHIPIAIRTAVADMADALVNVDDELGGGEYLDPAFFRDYIPNPSDLPDRRFPSALAVGLRLHEVIDQGARLCYDHCHGPDPLIGNDLDDCIKECEKSALRAHVATSIHRTSYNPRMNHLYDQRLSILAYADGFTLRSGMKTYEYNPLPLTGPMFDTRTGQYPSANTFHYMNVHI